MQQPLQLSIFGSLGVARAEFQNSAIRYVDSSAEVRRRQNSGRRGVQARRHESIAHYV